MHVVYIPKKISIHASAKEATIDTDGSKRYYWGFQSTPPRRRRRFYRLHTNIFAGIFQSTPPRRRRLAQPRMIRVRNLISIHASAKEATQTTRQKKLTEQFQSTPPRRRRPQHIVIPQLSCTYLVSTTFLSTIFSFISQYVVLFFLF